MLTLFSLFLVKLTLADEGWMLTWSFVAGERGLNINKPGRYVANMGEFGDGTAMPGMRAGMAVFQRANSPKKFIYGGSGWIQSGEFEDVYRWI